MEVPWHQDRCILCLNQDELTEEHIIPESLGGCLTSRFLCQKCNSTLGHKIEYAARIDPSIRIAVQQLANDIPELAKKLRENQRHTGESESVLSPGFIRNGGFRIFSKKLQDGSLVQPTDKAKKTIEKILNKSADSTLPIQEALRAFDEAPENKRVKIAPGLEIVKWRIDKIIPDYSNSPLMNPVIPLKIAYEFMACHLGTAIYNDVQPLNDIRQSIKKLNSDCEHYIIERLHATEYKPFHGICFEGNNPYASFQIRLFGWLAFRVRFLRLAINGPQYIYTYYLDSRSEDIREVDNYKKA